ncbi:MAG: CDP-alcohol phosphatidyltransferase family protein [Sandaracinaceae bacterium]|nr:CDP-alcohol phosphatidyltransferase family protein [Sandaracinaceae bacterium]
MSEPSAARLPPFHTLLKSREVEDPINLWVHRPLAYAFVALIFRTPVTPNQITVLATFTGLVAAGCWFVGTPTLMVAGGIILWTSAILDGADGILARAKQMHSQFGRALDGSMDMVVAIVSVSAAFFHLYLQQRNIWHLILAVPAIALTLPHIYLYDFYKESFLRMTRVGRGGEAEDLAFVKDWAAQLERDKAGFFYRFLVGNLLMAVVSSETALVRMLNPAASREGLVFNVTDQTAAIYHKHNCAPMQLWNAISLAPHTYIMSICGICDRLDIYLWIRLVVMNVIFVTVLIWQRIATRRTNAELGAAGLGPVAAG